MNSELEASMSSTYRRLLTDGDERPALSMRLAVLDLLESLTQRLSEISRAHGFATFGDYQLVAFAARAGGSTPSNLAVSLGITRAGVTGKLDRLERSGSVYRRRGQADGRSIRVVVTSEGMRQFASVEDQISSLDDLIEIQLGLVQLERMTALLRDARVAVDAI